MVPVGHHTFLRKFPKHIHHQSGSPELFLLRLRVTQKALQLPLFSFFFSTAFLGGLQELFSNFCPIAALLCDQDRSY